MKAGHLNSLPLGILPTLTSYRIGGRQQLPPEPTEDGSLRWGWKQILSTGVELHVAFELEVTLTRINLEPLPGSQLLAAEIWADGACIGATRGTQEHPLEGLIAIDLCHKAHSWILRLFPNMTDLHLPVPAFFGAVTEPRTLFPTPTELTWLEGRCPAETACRIGDDGHDDCRYAHSYLAQELTDRWECTATDGTGLLLERDAALPTDAYRLEVLPTQIRLTASTRLGLLYGLERIFELADGASIPCCRILDVPYTPMRGIHMFLPSADQLDFTRQLWKTVLIPYHYNMIFIELAGGMRFESHPEISEGWLEGNRLAKEGQQPPFPHGALANGGILEKADARALADYAAELGLELIPEVQTLGHVQYITYSHPEIAEIDPNAVLDTTDMRLGDIPPSKFYHHCYCPQNPKSYEILFDLMDEIIDVFRPRRFVHVGHDEVYQLGVCPRCREIPRDRLYEQDLLKLHTYLAKRGLRMMIWSDMLQPVSKYLCYPAAERLPKDIVMLDFIWYFHLEKDIEENLLAHGFDVMIGNLYSSHFPRYQTRIQQKGMQGGEVSFWYVSEEHALAEKGKLYDLIYSGEMLCSKTYCHEARHAYAAVIAERLPELRDRLRRRGVPKRSFKRLELPAPDAPDAPLSMRVCCHNAGYATAPLAEEVRVPVGSAADAIRFTHTTLYRETHKALVDRFAVPTVACYRICYRDGEVCTVSIDYDVHLRPWDQRFGAPLSEKYYRHEGYVNTWLADPVFVGYSESGTPITLTAYEWQNPYPEKEIASICCQETAESAAGVLLCGVELVTYQ